MAAEVGSVRTEQKSAYSLTSSNVFHLVMMPLDTFQSELSYSVSYSEYTSRPFFKKRHYYSDTL